LPVARVQTVPEHTDALETEFRYTVTATPGSSMSSMTAWYSVAPCDAFHTRTAVASWVVPAGDTRTGPAGTWLKVFGQPERRGLPVPWGSIAKTSTVCG
jgi:hypothetical protein